jgi:DNA mismatch repair ATPase MutS
MENTLKQDEIKTSLRATGHINDHWHHLSTSIKDGQEILSQLRDLLETVNKKASVLSRPRKHQRLQDAAEEIAAYQQQIQSYKDTLQLSLQTVTL